MDISARVEITPFQASFLFLILNKQILLSRQKRKLFDNNHGRRLKQGDAVALISDAGTPLISDPGFALVRECHRHGLTVSPVPGPSAAIAALSASGLASDSFVFEGFPSRNAGKYYNSSASCKPIPNW